jgi:LmbE family N-acetylglucosaminyl deacetylase
MDAGNAYRRAVCVTPLDPAQLEARRILVVAPHPDDESLGCGGLIATLAALGRRIHTVFVTEGGASHLNSPTWPRARLAAQREREAGEALAALGLGDHPRSFLRLRDAAMPKPDTAEGQAALARMQDIAKAFRPDLVLLPWRRDPHCDHQDSWRLATDALADAGLEPDRLEYAIWLDELGSEEEQPRPGEVEPIAFDIAPALERKRAAVAAHRSQTGDLIGDDPQAFRLTGETIARLVGPLERYWKSSG